jgi:putative protein-disulfide isomerase
MSISITYLFDPLCGWCYGASPMIQKLAQQSNLKLELAPTGLFAGVNGRAMDADFAQYAWSNDLRIGKITGQRFAESYRTQVLGKPGRLDSGTATLALTAVSLSEPQRELEVLKLIQEARYVHGLDITNPLVVGKLLNDIGLTVAANELAHESIELIQTNEARVQRAQRLMQTLGAQGVPALIVSDGKGHRLLRSQALYGGLTDLLRQVATA